MSLSPLSASSSSPSHSPLSSISSTVTGSNPSSPPSSPQEKLTNEVEDRSQWKTMINEEKSEFAAEYLVQTKIQARCRGDKDLGSSQLSAKMYSSLKYLLKQEITVKNKRNNEKLFPMLFMNIKVVDADNDAKEFEPPKTKNKNTSLSRTCVDKNAHLKPSSSFLTCSNFIKGKIEHALVPGRSDDVICGDTTITSGQNDDDDDDATATATATINATAINDYGNSCNNSTDVSTTKTTTTTFVSQSKIQFVDVSYKQYCRFHFFYYSPDNLEDPLFTIMSPMFQVFARKQSSKSNSPIESRSKLANTRTEIVLDARMAHEKFSSKLLASSPPKKRIKHICNELNILSSNEINTPRRKRRKVNQINKHHRCSVENTKENDTQSCCSTSSYSSCEEGQTSFESNMIDGIKKPKPSGCHQSTLDEYFVHLESLISLLQKQMGEEERKLALGIYLPNPS